MQGIYTSLHLLLTLCWHWLCSIIVHLTFNRPPTCCQKSINLWLCHDTSLKAAFTIFVSVMPHKPTKKTRKNDLNILLCNCVSPVTFILKMGTIWSSYTIICFKKMEYIDIIVLEFFSDCQIFRLYLCKII